MPFLDLRAQYDEIRGEVEEAMGRVVDSQGFILGPEVEALEEALARRLGVAHAVGCASGTDALLLPLRALEPEAGEEAVVPAFTFFATAGAAWNAGFRPSFCDVDPGTFNLTPETVEEAWTDRTRAVVPVHLYGQMAPMEPLVRTARERGAFVLEDGAQALGAERDGVPAGAAGDAAAFSFFPTKNLGGFGDGGLVATDDAALAETVRKLRVHGGRKMYHHERVGTNSRLDALQAAVLRAKLPHLDGWAGARRRHARLYDELLAEVDEVRTPRVEDGCVHAYNQYTLRVRRRDELRAFLDEEGVGTGLYYPLPLHLQPCFAELGYREGDLPVSERLCGEVVSLPVFPELGEARVRAVARAIRRFYGHDRGTR